MSCLLFDHLPSKRENAVHSYSYDFWSRLSSGAFQEIKAERIRTRNSLPINSNNSGTELDMRAYSLLKPLRKIAPS